MIFVMKIYLSIKSYCQYNGTHNEDRICIIILIMTANKMVGVCVCCFLFFVLCSLFFVFCLSFGVPWSLVINKRLGPCLFDAVDPSSFSSTSNSTHLASFAPLCVHQSLGMDG